MKQIAFVGGGSGGHIQPIASLLDYALEYTDIPNQSNRYRFGQQGGLEAHYADRYEHVTFVPVATGKLRRYWTLESTWQNIRDVFLILLGFFQSIYLLKKYRIDVVFCKGGFVCPPVAYAARLLRIPVLVHESDTHIGLANRLILPVAKTVFTGFGGIYTRECVVGQILSPQLLDLKSIKSIQIDKEKTIVLVMGGSQGAQILFDSVSTLMRQGVVEDVHFIFVLGTKNTDKKEEYEIQGQVSTVGFVSQQNIAWLYSVCDASISRGSATSLQEQQLFGLKKAIVPLPFTGGDHQTVNAKWYEEQYGDVWIPQDEHLQENLKKYLIGLKGYKKQSQMPTVDELCSASTILWKELMNE